MIGVHRDTIMRLVVSVGDKRKGQHKNSEASLSAGLAPEFRRTRGDKVIDYGSFDLVSRKSRILVFDLLASASG
jgi:hypothetical protein